MKKIISEIFIILLSIMITSCGDPVATEIIFDENYTGVEVEAIPPAADDISYSKGYDTLGTIPFSSDYGSIISVTNTKVTDNGKTIESNLSRAIFFDKNQPVKNSNGKTIAYRTRALGSVYFDDVKASIIPLNISFNSGGVEIDSVLGPYHFISFKEYKDNSNKHEVNFKLLTVSNKEISYIIPAPKNINAQVKIKQTRKGNKNELEAELKWDKVPGSDKIEVIIGGVAKGRTNVTPYLKVTVNDNGKNKLSKQLFNNFPFDKHEKIVFTFVRKIQKQAGVSDLIDKPNIVAQSLHSVITDL